jgi:hypothetical protein
MAKACLGDTFNRGGSDLTSIRSARTTPATTHARRTYVYACMRCVRACVRRDARALAARTQAGARRHYGGSGKAISQLRGAQGAPTEFTSKTTTSSYGLPIGVNLHISMLIST